MTNFQKGATPYGSGGMRVYSQQQVLDLRRWSEMYKTSIRRLFECIKHEGGDGLKAMDDEDAVRLVRGWTAELMGFAAHEQIKPVMEAIIGSEAVDIDPDEILAQGLSGFHRSIFAYLQEYIESLPPKEFKKKAPAFQKLFTEIIAKEL